MTKAKTITLYDPTLRDGQHAVAHQLRIEQIMAYGRAVNKAGIPIVEVGHGNGLGAASLQTGLAYLQDSDMIAALRSVLTTSRLAVFMLPGWGRTDNLREAISGGADVVRLGAHCTEADITERHFDFLAGQAVDAQGVLLMSHMASPAKLARECFKMQEYGASAVGIFDSSGHYLPVDVTERITAIVDIVSVPVLFHAHNNLSMAVANSIAAVEAGATIIDGCGRGFGAGAGNTQLEVLAPVLERLGYETGVDFYALLDAADYVENAMLPTSVPIDSVSIVSGLSGVFSGFKAKVINAAHQENVDARDIFFELGRKKIVAGQEDIILEVAHSLGNSCRRHNGTFKR